MVWQLVRRMGAWCVGGGVGGGGEMSRAMLCFALLPHFCLYTLSCERLVAKASGIGESSRPPLAKLYLRSRAACMYSLVVLSYMYDMDMSSDRLPYLLHDSRGSYTTLVPFIGLCSCNSTLNVSLSQLRAHLLLRLLPQDALQDLAGRVLGNRLHPLDATLERLVRR